MAFGFVDPALGAALGFADCATAMLADDGFNGSSCRLGGSVAICIFLFPIFSSLIFSLSVSTARPWGCPSFWQLGERAQALCSGGGGRRGDPLFRTLLGGACGQPGRLTAGAGVRGVGVCSTGVGGGGSSRKRCGRGESHTVSGNTTRADRKREEGDRGGEEVCV